MGASGTTRWRRFVIDCVDAFHVVLVILLLLLLLAVVWYRALIVFIPLLVFFAATEGTGEVRRDRRFAIHEVFFVVNVVVG